MFKFRDILLLIFVLVFSLGAMGLKVSSAGGVESKVVACSYSDRYHETFCKIARSVDPKELLSFNLAKDAEAAGFVPCKKCHESTSPSNISLKNKSSAR